MAGWRDSPSPDLFHVSGKQEQQKQKIPMAQQKTKASPIESSFESEHELNETFTSS